MEEHSIDHLPKCLIPRAHSGSFSTIKDEHSLDSTMECCEAVGVDAASGGSVPQLLHGIGTVISRKDKWEPHTVQEGMVHAGLCSRRLAECVGDVW